MRWMPPPCILPEQRPRANRAKNRENNFDLKSFFSDCQVFSNSDKMFNIILHRI